MTKTLNTLIKLNKNKLNRTLKEVEIREAEKLGLEEKQRRLLEEINQEVQKYSATEFGFMLEKYVESSRKMLKRLEAQVSQLDGLITKLRSDLQGQYSELKKFEIAAENKKIQERIKAQKLEEKNLDEVNITRSSHYSNSS
ncbi:MAG: hypothetical protein Tsb006_7460 [Rickettsiaceae bacterium]